MLDDASLQGLASLGGVLGQQLPEFGFRKVAQAQRLGLDVERVTALDVCALPARIDLIVAHVADSTQDHTLRELMWAVVMVRSQLPQD